MVRPSNPRLMARVLDAVANLGDTKGSSAREVLSFIRHSNVSSKNLTLQVHRALKHAVNAGLLRHRSGRYKVLATLNPNSVSNSAKEGLPANKEPANNQINEQKKSKSDIEIPISDVESSQTQERKKKITRRRNSRHRNTKVKRKSRRSPYIRRTNAAQNRKRQRKRTYEDDEEFEDHSSGQDFLQRRNDSSVLFNCKTKRSRVSKRELEADLSDESECDSNVSQKHVFRAKKSLHREPKRKMCAKSKRKSASRTRSPQLLQRAVQARQHSTEEIENDKQRCDENHGLTEHNITRQEVHKFIERVHESNNSNSGSTLENSRD
ncbi:PREDICTED: serine/threonine-protein kinase PRP4 homolog [Trachymyrmex septentrionalis]|uniref:serine/threonine-protein kinase PRP4 homolog n=1 Tax=Trachymyrmex septentrionalis TaxID=34720 RepID=UPI00084F5B9E|nr:PREDICTED: serine/threonine-protein kinase PRP4 homolog [Trachymyrmex septentrionalis]XP_018342146.1 PREDICTED: serine/threonine-protein kinase PRP4 homolog [Trachymyrmex septentrionalis]